MSIIYVYDGSFEGLLCAVHRAYYKREQPDEIACYKNLQKDMFSDYKQIETDNKKAKDVYNSISKKISKKAERMVYNIYLSDEKDKEEIIYNYLKIGYKTGAAIENYFANSYVMRAVKINQSVVREVNHMCGFVRFSSAKNGILFSKINPTHNILELLCRYFADRLKNFSWIIYDENRKLAAIYDTKRWEIFEADFKDEAGVVKKDVYSDLWIKFYDTVAIKERRNEKLRTHNMAKKYHKNILEMSGEAQRRKSYEQKNIHPL